MMYVKVNGSLFVSGIWFLLFMSFLFIGQLKFFNNHMSFYRSTINLKEAQIIRNMAQTYHLHEHECLYFNIGEVRLENQKYEITLKNGSHYSLESFK